MSVAPVSQPIAASTIAKIASAKPAAPAASAAPAPSTTSSASSASTTETAAQLAKETISQLQKQANSGDQLALRELHRRALLKQHQSGHSTESSEASAAESATLQEPGKGTQIDRSA